MKVNWARAHWIVGSVTLVLFILAGLYMRDVAGVPSLNDVPRLVFRSRFLFLLLIAVMNLALAGVKPLGWAQRIASVIVLVAPVPLIAAFFWIPAAGLAAARGQAGRCAVSLRRACCWRWCIGVASGRGLGGARRCVLL